MKKHIVPIVILFLLLSIVPSYAQTEEIKKSYKAQTLINELTESDVKFGEEITRMDFVVTLAKILNLGESVPEKYFYSDVKSFTENAGYVYSAYDIGLIEKAESLNGADAIKGEEAVKIALNALGYGPVAKKSGGYPLGYLTIAQRINILRGVDVEGALTEESALNLIYNMLTVNMLEQRNDGNTLEYVEKEETLLSHIYNIYEIEGVVSKTGYNTLSADERIGFAPVVEIEGNVYSCDEQSYSMLGINHQIFVKDDGNSEPKVICMFEEIEDSRTISLRDFDKKDGDEIFWFDEEEGERESESIKNATVIYNGRRVTGDTDEYFKSGTGNMRLVDNDGDGYDVVFINSYTFVNVYSMDTMNDILRDRNSVDYTINMGDAAYKIFDEDGELIDKFDISANEVYSVLKSNDGGFVELRRVGRKITGAIVQRENDRLVIDGTEYFMTEYFSKVYADKINLNKQTSFYVTEQDELISMAITDSDMMYGYVVNAWVDSNIDDALSVKIFSQTGEMGVYKTKKSVYVDGEKYKNMTTVYNAFLEGGKVKPQLIRYGVASDSTLKSIDFATTTIPEKLDVNQDERNSLVNYGKKTGIYKPYGGTISRFFHINSAVGFVIPENINETEDFEVVGKSYFVNNTNYELEYFDMDETGGAGAIIYYTSASNSIPDIVVPVLVESVVKAINGDDEIGYNINYFDGTQFATVFMPETVPVTKSAPTGTVRHSSHSVLSGGDIVRFVKNKSGEISRIDVEFDARKGVMDANKASANATRWNSDQSTNPQFHSGQVYTHNGTSMVISSARNLDGTYSFKTSDLKVLHGNTNQVIYNVSTEQVRPINAEQVKTQKSDGEDAYFAVVCQDTFISKFIVYYEDLKEEQ